MFSKYQIRYTTKSRNSFNSKFIKQFLLKLNTNILHVGSSQ